MKKLFILCCLITFTSRVCGQLSISVQSGIGSYSMAESYTNGYVDYLWEKPSPDIYVGLPLSEYREFIYLKQLSRFPPNIYYSVEMSFRINRIEQCIAFQYHSTGTRYYYEDYSGYMLMDYILSTNPLGYVFRYYVIDKLIDIGLSFSPLFQMSKYHQQTEYSFPPYEFNIDHTIKYFVNAGLQPGIIVKRNFNKFALAIDLGYYQQIYIGGLANNRIDVFKDYSKSSFNWSGVRIGLGLYYNIADIG